MYITFTFRQDRVSHPILLRRHPGPPDRGVPQEGLESRAGHVPFCSQRYLCLPGHLLVYCINMQIHPLTTTEKLEKRLKSA